MNLGMNLGTDLGTQASSLLVVNCVHAAKKDRLKPWIANLVPGAKRGFLWTWVRRLPACWH